MGKITVKISYGIITEESSRGGDFAETGWVDEEGMEFDNATEVAEFLRDEGVIEPSSSKFCVGVWYDTEGQMDCRTGETEIKSYHIYGATPRQEFLIYGKLFPELV